MRSVASAPAFTCRNTECDIPGSILISLVGKWRHKEGISLHRTSPRQCAGRAWISLTPDLVVQIASQTFLVAVSPTPALTCPCSAVLCCFCMCLWFLSVKQSVFLVLMLIGVGGAHYEVDTGGRISCLSCCWASASSLGQGAFPACFHWLCNATR